MSKIGQFVHRSSILSKHYCSVVVVIETLNEVNYFVLYMHSWRREQAVNAAVDYMYAKCHKFPCFINYLPDHINTTNKNFKQYFLGSSERRDFQNSELF